MTKLISGIIAFLVCSLLQVNAKGMRASTEPTIKLSKSIQSAWQTTHIETNLKELKPLNGKLRVSFKQHQIDTFRLIPERK